MHEKRNIPVTGFNDPVVFIGEDDKPARNTESGEDCQFQCAKKEQKSLLLQSMEHSDAIAFRKAIIFASMNNELRRRPLVDGICGAEPTYIKERHHSPKIINKHDVRTSETIPKVLVPMGVLPIRG